MRAIRAYERELGERFLAGLPEPSSSTGRRRWTAACRRSSSTSTACPRSTWRARLAERGIGVWYAGDWYCVNLAERLPEQSIRIGLVHYNTVDEVDRTLAELARLS